MSRHLLLIVLQECPFIQFSSLFRKWAHARSDSGVVSPLFILPVIGLGVGLVCVVDILAKRSDVRGSLLGGSGKEFRL